MKQPTLLVTPDMAELILNILEIKDVLESFDPKAMNNLTFIQKAMTVSTLYDQQGKFFDYIMEFGLFDVSREDLQEIKSMGADEPADAENRYRTVTEFCRAVSYAVTHPDDDDLPDGWLIVRRHHTAYLTKNGQDVEVGVSDQNDVWEFTFTANDILELMERVGK